MTPKKEKANQASVSSETERKREFQIGGSGAKYHWEGE